MKHPKQWSKKGRNEVLPQIRAAIKVADQLAEAMEVAAIARGIDPERRSSYATACIQLADEVERLKDQE